jgi:phage-related protein
MKKTIFLGSSKDDLRDFPEEVRRDAGIELYQVQLGLDPSDWKPMPGIGAGVREIRVRANGIYRIIYISNGA